MTTLSNTLAALILFGAVTAVRAQSVELPDSPDYILRMAAEAHGAEASSSATDPASDSQAASATADTAARLSSVETSPIYPGSHPYLHRVVPADMGPQPLTAGQKLKLSLRSATSPTSFGTALFSAGLTHLNNSRPHYGSDRAGFGERLGAAKLKASSESIFSYGLFAAAFRQDPHYYVMGSAHPFMHRVAYSATRVILTRNDSGSTGFNWSKIFGMASSNALTNTYYPDVDREFRATVTAFGTNILTTAATNQLNEFLPDLMHKFRHKKN